MERSKVINTSLRMLIAALFTGIAWSPSIAQVRLVADIVKTTDPTMTNPNWDGPRKVFSLHDGNSGRSFFIADGRELWTSNGTMEGTMFVRKFLHIDELKVVSGIAYFVAFTRENGLELWRSDGTKTGTTILRDIWSGTGSSNPLFLTECNEYIFFSAHGPTEGRELWKTDGTASGTVLVKDIRVGVEGGLPRELTASNGKLFFSANNGLSGYELYVSDGTATGTTMLKDIDPGAGASSAPGPITDVNGTVFFTATDPSISRQLWKSDGTTAGTQLVKVIRTGNFSSQISQIVNVQGTAYFEATDGRRGFELWKSDGTAAGTVLVKDLLPSTLGAREPDHIDALRPVGNLVYFTGRNAVDGSLLFWRSDGTDQGTFPLKTYDIGVQDIIDLNGAAVVIAGTNLYRTTGASLQMVKEKVTSTASSFVEVPELRVIDGKGFFFGNGAYMRTDGTSGGTIPIQNLKYPHGSHPQFLMDGGNGKLFFNRVGGPQFDWSALWVTKGTEATTMGLKHLENVTNMLSYGGKFYVVGFDTYIGGMFWTSDGTPEGTIRISDTTWPYDLEGANGLVFFSNATSDAKSQELWATDGKIANVWKIKDVSVVSFPRNLTGAGNRLFFTGKSPSYGEELWKSDGTSSGTMMVKDITPGTNSTVFRNLIALNGRLYFQINRTPTNAELWTSDGTSAGTLKIADIPVDASNPDDVSNLMASSTQVFYSIHSQDPVTYHRESSLWRSTGTAAGTIKLIDFPDSWYVSILGTIGSRAIFAVQSGSYTELWKSDGTPSGTTRIRKFYGDRFPFTNNVAVKGNVLYFTTIWGADQVLLWRTNGWYSGTYTIPFDGDIISDGPRLNMVACGPYVYFTGVTREHGVELYLIDENTSATAMKIDNGEESVANYPNPFTSTFVLRVDGEENEAFSIRVIGPGGRNVSNSLLDCNMDHTLGESWNPGLYVIQIRQQEALTIRRVMKLK